MSLRIITADERLAEEAGRCRKRPDETKVINGLRRGDARAEGSQKSL